MKKLIIPGIIFALFGLMVLSVGGSTAEAKKEAHLPEAASREYHLLAAATPLPTSVPIPIGSTTPEPRVLPPVGRNAGLVIGAGVLVLIILFGVLGSRLRTKH